jgi:hypothetical protein
MIIVSAEVTDAKDILDLQKLAYQSEAQIYNDYTIPPLTQSLEEIRDDFEKQVFLKALTLQRYLCNYILDIYA